MLATSLPDDLGHVDFRPQPRIEFAQSDLDIAPQAGEHVDTLEQFTAKLFLRRLR